MRRLTLIRHAKASSPLGGTDFERPLSPQGLQEAPVVAKAFAAQDDPPDRILSSGAQRALHTAQIFAAALHYPPEEIDTVPDIYSGYDTTLVNLLQWQPDDIKHLLLVGHNPAISQLAQYLCAGTFNFLPCTVLQLQLSITQWCELSEACGAVLYHDYPR
ncbi:histidine phosphatase family protein [Motiliproteus sp. SC1-56]|uniref:SixA phosphatase family protein n=1 Tax=Motiliproteus sp. SC1-56 TaxID=2799565 RepID=UPI001A9026B9|nr:histidine phosphatase family protein [Motiliproteus sp. SC1-56]